MTHRMQMIFLLLFVLVVVAVKTYGLARKARIFLMDGDVVAVLEIMLWALGAVAIALVMR